jgi:hypothetical protein
MYNYIMQVSIVGAFAAFHQKRWIMAGISLLLMIGWHFGSSVLVAVLAIFSFCLTYVSQLHSKRLRLSVAGILFLLGAILTALTENHHLLPRVWIPLLVACILMLAGRKATCNPSFTATELAATYLFLAQTITLLFANPGVLHWLETTTGNRLVGELPTRLIGGMQVASVALLLAISLEVLKVSTSFWISISGGKKAFLTAALGLSMYAMYAHRDFERKLWTGQCAFFKVEDAHVTRQQSSPETLKTLDPRSHKETEFFASLGDFLLCPIVSEPPESPHDAVSPTGSP